MAYPRLVLKRGRERWLLKGHPWVFRVAVDSHPGNASPGEIVDVLDKGGRFVGRGYYNPGSSIPVRVLTRDPDQVVDYPFIRGRIHQAAEVRRRGLDLGQTTGYRVVHSENDFLPGLIVDRYGDFLVVQIHTLGMEGHKGWVVDALNEVLAPRGIYERSNVGGRQGEGLETMPVGALCGDPPPDRVAIREHGVRFWCDIREGQKTGFFLDQRENRLGVRYGAAGKAVLNCFSYSGGFSVYAALGGATCVESVDASAPALELARQNLDLNGVDVGAHPCVEANVFDHLKTAKQVYDLVVIDPPAFAKSRASLKRAVRAYGRLNRMAMEVTRPGGLLVSASCSPAVDYVAFLEVLKGAAAEAGRNVQVVRSHLQSVDHPTLLAFPEGQYLKCFFCVVD